MPRSHGPLSPGRQEGNPPHQPHTTVTRLSTHPWIYARKEACQELWQHEALCSMEPVQQSKTQPGRNSVETETRGLAAQHPLADRPVPRAALTGKTGLPGASSKAEGARPAQRSSWQWGDHNHRGWAAQPSWNSSGPSSPKRNSQREKIFLPISFPHCSQYLCATLSPVPTAGRFW